MIKDREIAMVNGATLALEFKNKHPRAWDDDAVAFAMTNLKATSESKLYGIAAANEILKLKKIHSDLTDKQLVQFFVNNIFQFVSKIDETMKEN
jgi:hypothetical protein